MGVSMRVVHWLRHHGFDTVHLRDENLQTLSDELIFQKASLENRIVLTFDLDFGEIMARSKGRSPGVILFRLHNTRAEHVMNRLMGAFNNHPLYPENFVLTIEESRYRLRRFPEKDVLPQR
jgi:predicted nuclease of predicted toxin-antitoxin system